MIQKRLKTGFKIVFLLISLSASGQNKYWVYLKDKGDSGANPPKEWLQLPVYESYIQNLNAFGKVENQSRWLNAISLNLSNPEQIEQIEQLPFVESVEAIQVRFHYTSTSEESTDKTSLALEQINGLAMHRAGLKAKGVKIGIIDGGFYKADLSDALLTQREKLKVFRDYVTPKNLNPYHGRESFLDWHGTSVWKMIAGYDADAQITYGLATEADFYLARTDHGKNESRIEEDNLVAALEWMDSLGVKLINISLGYATRFDNPAENHKPEEVDGKSSALTKALQLATEQRGMIIIVAAGNEGGDKNWQVLSIPADAQDAISVGATRFDIPAKAGYSSIGPETSSFTKPEVSCYSGSGTSFSAPIITGLVACMLQFDSTLSHHQIKDLLVRSSHLYPYANNYIGYGVPDVVRLLALMKAPEFELPKLTQELVIKDNSYTLSTKASEVLVFHKKDARNVVDQAVMAVKKGKLKIDKPQGVVRSTLNFDGQTLEIFWE